MEVEGGSRSPVVLDSDEAARAVFIVLEPGQSLGDHQVKEHAFVLVVDGMARGEAGDRTGEAGPGALCLFDPHEPGAGRAVGRSRQAPGPSACSSPTNGGRSRPRTEHGFSCCSRPGRASVTIAATGPRRAAALQAG